MSNTRFCRTTERTREYHVILAPDIDSSRFLFLQYFFLTLVWFWLNRQWIPGKERERDKYMTMGSWISNEIIHKNTSPHETSFYSHCSLETRKGRDRRRWQTFSPLIPCQVFLLDLEIFFLSLLISWLEWMPVSLSCLDSNTDRKTRDIRNDTLDRGSGGQ